MPGGPFATMRLHAAPHARRPRRTDPEYFATVEPEFAAGPSAQQVTSIGSDMGQVTLLSG